MTKIRLGITGKLLAIVVPLVVLPILATGLLGYWASEEIVTRLLNQAQISLAREIAEQIGQDFKASRADLKLISRLPVLKDYHYNRFYGLQSEADISRKQMQEFFRDLAHKSSLYYRISYLDDRGMEVANVSRGRIVNRSVTRTELPFFPWQENLLPDRTYISEVTSVGTDNHRVVFMARPLYDVWNKISGVVLLELDIQELARRTLSRRIGQNGYAFIVDSAGSILVHPEPRHAGRASDVPRESSIEELIQAMLRKGQGMMSYYDQGRKVAAFTRVPNTGWIIAATLPVAEFTAHLDVIKKQILQIILIAVSVVLAVGVFFSWRFLRPIKKLARATNVITTGNLPPEIKGESTDELGVLTSSFNQMVRNLRQIQTELVKSEKLVSLGRLAAGVAHEIRNPLNTIGGALVLLQRKNANRPEVTEFTSVISEEVSRLDHFISDFLSYSRQPPLKPTPTDINEMLVGVLSAHATNAEEKGVHLRKELDYSLPPYALDPFQMERAIVNIVVNALEAMPKGGILTVSTLWWPALAEGLDGEGLELSISDTGAGMTPEQINSAFEPFFTTKEMGTGLGLPLAQSIIETHGGSIDIRSHPGGGTRVTISLPRYPIVERSGAGDG